MKLMETNKYYVYVYLDPRNKGEYVYGNYKFDYEPFYIGKGSGNRYLKHLTETKNDTANLFKFRFIDKLRGLGLVPIIVKLSIGLEESEAYKLETGLIQTIGRRCDKSGSLTNIVTDGKPPKNYKQLSEKVIDKIIKRYNEGCYLKHIGDELGLDELKVKRTLIENGITPKRKPPINKKDISAETITAMVNDYNNGLSIRKLKDKYKFSFEVVRKTLNTNGVILRGYDYVKTEDHKKKIADNRKVLIGEENPCFKPLSKDEILKLKTLRFVEKMGIKEIMNIMKINQKKYYYYINQ